MADEKRLKMVLGAESVKLKKTQVEQIVDLATLKNTIGKNP